MTNAEVIIQTVKWIEDRLRENLPVTVVANKSGYSLHHFIRLFGGVVGIPPKEYIARRKLSEAARELAAGGRRVTDVAFDYGFKDLETFTRAFRREMGTTPTAVRGGQPFAYFEAARESRAAPPGGSTLDAPVQARVDSFCLAGWSIRVNGETDAVGRLWARFVPRAASIPRTLVPLRLHQLAWWSEDAEDWIEIMVAAKMKDLAELPIDLVGKTVPACTCLVFTHHGSMARIADTYRAIYAEWLPSMDRRPELPFNFERYLEGENDPYADGYSMQICVPVR